MIDAELRPSRHVSLSMDDLASWQAEPMALDCGVLLVCREGAAQIRVNFDRWMLRPGAVITLFPGDVVRLSDVSGAFRVERLTYDAALLREASLQMEHTVYSQLRQDRCRTESPVVTRIVDGMFALLGVYFAQADCRCLDALVLLQLKAFFLGFCDYLERFPAERREQDGSRRIRVLFNDFMFLLEQRYKSVREVGAYAALLNISPKYLNRVVQQLTGHSAKTLIDQFVILQLKLALRDSSKSVKQIACDYHFSDRSFFSRYFKQHIGMTPQQFRKGGR